MRIISGIHKGHKLKAPKGVNTRPTADRVKEAVFSVLGSKTQGALVLDLFAGSGALSFEALSRGAEKAFLIEKNKQAYGIIMDNAEKLKVNDKIEVFLCDINIYMNQPYIKENKFDLIFLDPPYDSCYHDILYKIEELEILSDNGVIVVETSNKNFLKNYSFNNIQIVKESVYGDTKVYYFQKTGV